MVKIREEHHVHSQNDIDLDAWLNRLQEKSGLPDISPLRRACEMSRVLNDEVNAQGAQWIEGVDSFQMGLEMCEILVGLHLDLDSLVAAVIYRAVREERLSLDRVGKEFGPDVAKLVEGVSRMAAISQFLNPKRNKSVLGQKKAQLENVRKMLVAMVDDVRVVLIKLAERTAAIRAVKNSPPERQVRVAREIFEIYAPLAHRLGIGHVKWELEDLSFRYLQPDAYKQIASLLAEKRSEREKYIEEVIHDISVALEKNQIQAEISGRAKHIYSIWRKMRRKNIDFYQVYDIRAIRILVPDVASCYTVLGIVHAMWKHIPKEFDDYIATPKENGYRSLHTAVIGSKGRILEVQIRTRQMHDEAELGVCAHWRYKESPHTKVERSYEEKISWLRQVLEWNEELSEKQVDEFAEQLRSEASDERIYVFTPEGHVLDLAAGATPLDFAYHVHTEVGHRCRGAKVNGRIVPLTYVLQTGQQVEILTGKEAVPSRDWLNANAGYLFTSRARSKVQHWFKQQDRDKNIVDGKALIAAEFKRLSLRNIDLDSLAAKFNLKSAEDLLASVGAGDTKITQVINALNNYVAIDHQKNEVGVSRASNEAQSALEAPGISVQGVGNLMVHIAKCCKPVPGEPIVGYVTMGRGVTIHGQHCVHLQQLNQQGRDRFVQVSWGANEAKSYPVDIHISSFDRRGLLKDITEILAKCNVNITAMNTLSNTRTSTADMKITLEVSGIEQLSQILAKINQLPNIIEVNRIVA